MPLSLYRTVQKTFFNFRRNCVIPFCIFYNFALIYILYVRPIIFNTRTHDTMHQLQARTLYAMDEKSDYLRMSSTKGTFRGRIAQTMPIV